MTPSFIFDPQKGQTPQSVARQRELASAILRGIGNRPARNVGEGIGNALASIGHGIQGRVLNNRANAAEAAGMQSAADLTTRYSESQTGGSTFPAIPGASDASTAAGAAGVSQGTANRNPMALASNLIGRGEVPDNKLIREYLNNGGVNLDPATTAWCAAFVNASLGQAGMQGTGSNMARSFLNWGDAVDTPQVGDLAVFSRGDPNGPFGHVGFYQGTNPDGSINVLGGNQGNRVSIAPYSASQLLGYRRAPGAAGATGAVNAMASGAPIPPQAQVQAPADIPSWDVFPDAPTQLPAMEVPYTDEPMPAPMQTSGSPMQRLEMSGRTDMPTPPNFGLLTEIMNNPWASPEMKRMAMDEISRHRDSQDPLRRLQIEQAQIEVDQMRNPQPKRLAPINAGDGRLYDPNTGEWIIAPGSGGPEFRLATPDEAQQYGAPAGQFGPDGRFYPINPPSGMTVESDGQGGFRLVQGPGAGSGDRPFTEQQSKDNVYVTRGRGALPTLDQYEQALTAYGDAILDQDPTGYLRGPLQSEEYQIARAAADEFLQAILRKDTGAAITAQEQELYGKTYLPQPGDSPAVLQYKREARNRALAAIESGMSPAQMAAVERAHRQQFDAAQESGQPQAQPQEQAPATPQVSIPQAAVEALINDPSLAPQFDAKFGPGAAAQILGAL